MSKSSGVAVSYRSLQAIHDLRCLAASASERTLDRLAAGTSNAVTGHDLRRLIDEGCRLSEAMAGAVHSALLLAATLPDDDFDGFRVSTAILIADRLQGGAGENDLYWHWDAFQAHYRTLSDRDRAAVLQGFRQLHEDGWVALFDPPEGNWIATETAPTVRTILQTLLSGTESDLARRIAGLCIEALDSRDGVAELALAWTEESDAILRLDPKLCGPLIRGIRHVYEARSEWQAYPGRSFDPSADLPIMIPSLAD